MAVISLLAIQLLQGVAMNQPAQKVSVQGHIIYYPEGEHKLCDCREKEADLCLKLSRIHLRSFYFHNKLNWKIIPRKSPVVNLCMLTAVTCRFHVCCCIAWTGKVPLKSARR